MFYLIWSLSFYLVNTQKTSLYSISTQDPSRSNCSCHRPTHLDCSYLGLQSFPTNIPVVTSHLQLKGNKIRFIPIDGFKHTPHIRTVDLTDNLLGKNGIPSGAFLPLRHLEFLFLSDNSLEEVPKHLPITLRSLYLSGNNLKTIDPGLFSMMRSLRHLHLHDNLIQEKKIKKRAFHGLDNLAEMTLSNNAMTSFPPVPQAAEVIYLHDNFIRMIPERSFERAHNVRMLYLQNNRITNRGIRKHSFTGLRKINYLDLSGNKLRSFPLFLPSHLKRLHLERNRIRNLTRLSLERLQRLEYLLLQQNRLRFIENNSLTALTRLKTLHIYQNKLKKIPKLPPSIQILICMGNHLKRVESRDFESLTNLRQLDLRNNKLTNRRLERGAIRKLNRLLTVDFSNNRLRAVPGFPRRVRIIHLSYNRITNITSMSFANQHNLRHLMLDNNRLEDEGIDSAALKYTTKLEPTEKHLATNTAQEACSLKWLNCRSWSSQIQHINKNYHSVEVLDLSSNKLTEIPRNLPSSLEQLYLRNNRIERIPSDSFLSTKHLKGIFLDGNDLMPSKQTAVAFTPLLDLQRVDITWKRTSQVQPNITTSNAGSTNEDSS